jgi:phosphate uptake regulator
MDWSDLLARIVAWLRAGYPQGVPEQDYVPLLAVLGRRLSDEEIDQVVGQLVQQGALPADRVGAGVAITRVAHELPGESDLLRVRDRLRAAGWPIDDSWTTSRGPAAESFTPLRALPGIDVQSEVRSSMRTRYHENLRELAHRLHAICLRDRTAIAVATDALLAVDLEQSQTAIDIGGEVEAMYRAVELEALRLLALESPVAGELRQVVTALQLTGNLQRMAALATHIATAARRRHPEPLVPEPVRPLIVRMGAAALAIATSAAAVLDSPDSEAAAMLDGQDDTMDRLHEQLLATVLGPAWDHGITAAVDLALVGRYYERFADNAVEVGRRTIFLTTGETADQWVPAHSDD